MTGGAHGRGFDYNIVNKVFGLKKASVSRNAYEYVSRKMGKSKGI